MHHRAFPFWHRTRFYSERLRNLILLNTFLDITKIKPRTPYKIFVNSVPKSGTNLLTKTLGLFPTVWDSKISLHSEMAGTPWRPSQPLRRRFLKIFPSFRASYKLGKAAIFGDNLSAKETTEYIKIGGFHNVFVSVQEMDNLLYHLKPGWFAVGHVPYSFQFEKLLLKHNFKMLLIVRDPRDVINSELNFFLNTEKLALHEYYREKSRNEGIMSIMNGLGQNPKYPNQPNFRNILLDYIPWLNKPYAYVTTFEKLVGPQGGGDSKVQTQQIREIAQHLDFSISEKELNYIKHNAFGGTHTFRKGAIGAWERKFTYEQKLACKELIGDILIELDYEKDTNW